MGVIKPYDEKTVRTQIVCSATGASSARNMAYMVRLALWGPELAFNDFPEFLTAVQSRGLGTLQIVAMEMKSRGMYVSRMLSFEGADFDLVKVPLRPQMFQMYSHACRVWSLLRVRSSAFYVESDKVFVWICRNFDCITDRNFKDSVFVCCMYFFRVKASCCPPLVLVTALDRALYPSPL